MKRILRFAAALLALCLPLTGLGEAAPTPVAEIDHYVVQLDDHI